MIIFLILPAFIIFMEFIGFLINGRGIVGSVFLTLAEIAALVILPYLYLSFGRVNDCCGDNLDTAAFSPQHRLSILVVIVLSLLSYVFSKLRSKIASPIIEILVNIFLITGTVISILIAIHSAEALFIWAGASPITLLGIMMLAKNQQLFRQEFADIDKTSANKLASFSWRILSFPPLLKFPILFILCLPILVIVAGLLLIFGQKPDSFIRAFTDTYKHGFSQWDYKCANVQCGGHYLCSVAAQGHKKLVKPIRLGVRNGGMIVCNRQLLVSNAFEDMMQEKTPRLHKAIRKRYNRVGNIVHKHYHFFNIKLVSDSIYLLMKPLEWCFLIALYMFDKKPENRIAKQYLHHSDRQIIDNKRR